MQRRDFISKISILSLGTCLPFSKAGALLLDDESGFAKHLHPVGRALELEGYYVWCNSPIQDENGVTHLFFSRWGAKKGMGGWINGSEIVHATSISPQGPYTVLETILKPGAGAWDATTCHNPSIKKVDGKYCLFYMGNSNGKTDTKRIELAIAPTLNGPWQRPEQPLLLPGSEGSWDDHCTTNPAFINNGNEYWLYYKCWNTKEYLTGTGPVKGNRKYGLAIAKNLEGPYEKYAGNPVIDFSYRGNNTQLEDAFVWNDKKGINMIARDMGYYNHEDGIILHTKNGVKWSLPKIAYYGAEKYMTLPPAPPHLKKWGRFERPQILFIKNNPAYLFTAMQGGKYETSSSFIFKIT